MHTTTEQNAVCRRNGAIGASGFDESLGIENEPSGAGRIVVAPIQERRITPATRGRINNMRKLINELISRKMLVDQIATFLSLSQSGARKYIRHLHFAGLIELERCVDGSAGHVGKTVCRISPDLGSINAFLDALYQPKPGGGGRQKRRVNVRELCMADSERHFHLLEGNTHIAARMNPGPAKRDALVAALFGPPLSPTEK